MKPIKSWRGSRISKARFDAGEQALFPKAQTGPHRFEFRYQAGLPDEPRRRLSSPTFRPSLAPRPHLNRPRDSSFAPHFLRRLSRGDFSPAPIVKQSARRLQRWIGECGSPAKARVLFTIAALGGGMILPAGCNSTSTVEAKNARAMRAQSIASAREALEADQPADAVNHLAPYEERAADDADLQLLLGQARVELARTASASDPSRAQELVRRAERNLDRAASAAPKHPRPWIERAEACALTRRESEALAHADRATKLLTMQPNLDCAHALASFYLQRAEAAELRGDRQAANEAARAVVRNFELAATMGADSDLAFVRLRNEALVMLNRGIEAMERTKQSIASAEDRQPWYEELRRCAWASQHQDTLARMYSDLEQSSPCFATHWNSGRYWLERANEARLQNQIETASHAYRRAEQQFGLCFGADSAQTAAVTREHARALSGAGWCAWESGAFDEAGDQWMAALRASPELAGIDDVMDRDIFDGLEALAERYASEQNETRARELLATALKDIVSLEPRHAQWLESTALWSRRSAVEAQRAGRVDEAQKLFVQSRDAYLRAAALQPEPHSLAALRLRVEAVEIALYHLIPSSNTAEQASQVEACESELRALLTRPANGSASEPEQRTLEADIHQHLGHLLFELRGDKAAAREAFAACLAADPDRARALQVRWYLERTADSPKEQQR